MSNIAWFKWYCFVILTLKQKKISNIDVTWAHRAVRVCFLSVSPDTNTREISEQQDTYIKKCFIVRQKSQTPSYSLPLYNPF